MGRFRVGSQARPRPWLPAFPFGKPLDCTSLYPKATAPWSQPVEEQAEETLGQSGQPETLAIPAPAPSILRCLQYSLSVLVFTGMQFSDSSGQAPENVCRISV